MLKQNGKFFAVRHIVMCAALLIGAFALSACDLAENQLKMDRAANMEMQDFRDGLAPRPIEEGTASAAAEDEGIPSLQSYIADPAEGVKPMPLVSVSVNQSIPLRDVLYELAKQADYDLELDPRIRGSIIFSARNKPFDVVIARIADISGLRYKFQDDSVRVEVDTPYQKLYKIDYLSYVRTNSGSISNNVAVVSGDGADTGSKFKAETKSEADFWGELQTNLDQILGLSRRAASLMTSNDPELTAAAQNPAPVAPVVAESNDGQTQVNVQPVNPVLRVSSLPNVSNNRNNDEEDTTAVDANFSVNKQAGIISVFATERQHEQVKEYLTHLERSVASQVLVEAKILEVSLTDEFSAGIDWNLFSGKQGGIGVDITGGIRPALDPVVQPTTDFFAAYLSEDLNVFAEAISRFGTVRALASPRLTVLNNQSAVLNVADNQVYFEVDIDITRDQDTGEITNTQIDTDIRNVPEGVLINVQPSINMDNRTISMSVRPTVTRIVDYVDDPGVAYAVADADIDGITSRVPVVNVQEMDSVIKMNSGQAIIMGGLMQDRTVSEQNGVPVLSEIPMFGSIFKSHNDRILKSELVIFLKATIVENSNIDETDKDIYKKFGHDRRPMNL